MNTLMLNIGKDCEDIIKGYVVDLIDNDVDNFNKKIVVSSDLRSRIYRSGKRFINDIIPMFMDKKFPGFQNHEDYIVRYVRYGDFFGDDELSVEVVLINTTNKQVIQLDMNKTEEMIKLEKIFINFDKKLKNDEIKLSDFNGISKRRHMISKW